MIIVAMRKWKERLPTFVDDWPLANVPKVWLMATAMKWIILPEKSITMHILRLLLHQRSLYPLRLSISHPRWGGHWYLQRVLCPTAPTHGFLRTFRCQSSVSIGFLTSKCLSDCTRLMLTIIDTSNSTTHSCRCLIQPKVLKNAAVAPIF